MFPLTVIVRSCLDELLCLVGSADRGSTIGERILRTSRQHTAQCSSDGRNQPGPYQACVVAIQPSSILRQAQFEKTAWRNSRSDLLMRFHGKILVSACPERNL